MSIDGDRIAYSKTRKPLHNVGLGLLHLVPRDGCAELRTSKVSRSLVAVAVDDLPTRLVAVVVRDDAERGVLDVALRHRYNVPRREEHLGVLPETRLVALLAGLPELLHEVGRHVGEGGLAYLAGLFAFHVPVSEPAAQVQFATGLDRALAQLADVVHQLPRELRLFHSPLHRVSGRKLQPARRYGVEDADDAHHGATAPPLVASEVVFELDVLVAEAAEAPGHLPHIVLGELVELDSLLNGQALAHLGRHGGVVRDERQRRGYLGRHGVRVGVRTELHARRVLHELRVLATLPERLLLHGVHVRRVLAPQTPDRFNAVDAEHLFGLVVGELLIQLLLGVGEVYDALRLLREEDLHLAVRHGRVGYVLVPVVEIERPVGDGGLHRLRT